MSFGLVLWVAHCPTQIVVDFIWCYCGKFVYAAQLVLVLQGVQLGAASVNLSAAWETKTRKLISWSNLRSLCCWQNWIKAYKPSKNRLSYQLGWDGLNVNSSIKSAKVSSPGVIELMSRLQSSAIFFVHHRNTMYCAWLKLSRGCNNMELRQFCYMPCSARQSNPSNIFICFEHPCCGD